MNKQKIYGKSAFYSVIYFKFALVYSKKRVEFEFSFSIFSLFTHMYDHFELISNNYIFWYIL